jgi:hypothetical protein
VNPFEPVGTNVQLPPPFVSELIVHNTAELGLVTATLVSVDANPATVAVTVIPLGPDDGLSVRLATVPVNVAVAVSPLDPVAVTMFEAPPLLNVNPFEPVGTNVQLPPPLVSELIVHNAAELGLVTATLVSVDANPAAVTVTVTPPLGPDEGESVSVGAGSMASATIPQANEVLPRPAVTV